MASSFTVSSLRRAYLSPRRKTGSVNVEDIGLTFDGRLIARFDFDRYNRVGYIDCDNEVFASFADIAAIDD